jgi:cation diffusion facilitator CzcD-associated flavoprotein CzcO
MQPEPKRGRARVVVVGGGAAGLSAAAALRVRGIDSTVLDRSRDIGATWDDRYERLHLHTVRRFSGLAHRGLSRDLPRYVSKAQYAAYLREYAEHFDLDVRLGVRVETVREAQPTGWQLETADGGWLCEAVVVATGHYASPRTPDWPGRSEFPGTVVHSSEYVTGRSYEGQRVLVVGIGNSGAEIAADLAECGAAWVAIAIRTPPPIVPRELLGCVPVQLLGLALTPIGLPRVVDRVGAALRRVSVGDLTRHGIGKAAWGPFTARRPAVIDVGFLEQLRGGRIEVRPAVETVDARGAVYVDGSAEVVDAVVVATGFETGLDRLLEPEGLVRSDGEPMFRSGRPTSRPGLYFVGFDETVRGHLFEANRDSRRLAKHIAASLGRRDC